VPKKPHYSTRSASPASTTPIGLHRNSSQSEREAFAAANVSRAIRLAVIAAVRAGSAVLAVANAPS
jgi:hypothetical protein